MAEFVERKRWMFLGLPFTFTKFIIKEDLITIDRGFFRKVEDDCYMYKVQDVKLVRNFWERIVRIGTVVCYTGDTTDKVLEITHIKHSQAVKDFILQASEAARMKRRTLNTLNIGAEELDGVDPADVE